MTKNRFESSIHFVDTRGAAQMFGVSVMTINRWRRAGLMPSPIYASGNITLFWRETIVAWAAAGRPMCDKKRCQEAVDAVGIEEAASWIDGEPYVTEDQHQQNISDAAEQFLNASGEFLATAEKLRAEMKSTAELLAARN